MQLDQVSREATNNLEYRNLKLLRDTLHNTAHICFWRTCQKYEISGMCTVGF